jgi:putative transposase
MVSAPGRRQQVEYARRRGLSCRRACALLKVARSALEYRSKLAVKDAPAMSRMSELAAQYPRYGYRQVRIFLARDGHHMGTDRAYRLWKRAGLQVPRRRPRRRVAASRPRPTPPTGPNHVWAYDFVFDTCATGQQIKCLTVVDEWTREALAIDVAGSIRSGRVIEVLAKLVSTRGAPRYLRSDNGPEFISTAVLRWVTEEGFETAHIAPGKPWQNGTNESFNGKFRNECLSMEWFRTRREAAATIETWRQHYNAVRPHSSLGYLTPNEFSAKQVTTTTQSGEAVL